MSSETKQILTTDGIPLEVSLKKAEKKNKIKAFLLVAPLLLFLFITYVFPIGEMFTRSVDDKMITNMLPKTFKAMEKWNGKELPPEEVFAGFYSDYKVLIENQTQGKLGQRLNKEKNGFTTILKKLFRKMKNFEDGNAKEQIMALHKRFRDVKYWQAIKRTAPPFTTAKYLKGKLEIKKNTKKRSSKFKINILGCRENNLKNINVEIPLNKLVTISGVSGSGKSTLINKILYPSILNYLNDYSIKPGEFEKISGDLDKIDYVEYISQKAIGKSSRSNPVTYIKAYDEIRKLFSSQRESKIRGYKPKHFSFNVDGGRCESCKGEGINTIEMQFMPDVNLTCESCNGTRFKREILEVNINGKNISDILNLTVDDAIIFFNELEEIRISDKLSVLQKVGLGYIKLGQSSSTLSGGEAQRVKLAYFLSVKTKSKNGLFLFDEPTTGLHFDDINKLLQSINQLIDKGNSVIIIEHNLEIIKASDHIIDLGPYGGNKGGEIVFQGDIDKFLKTNTLTAINLKKVMN